MRTNFPMLDRPQETADVVPLTAAGPAVASQRESLAKHYSIIFLRRKWYVLVPIVAAVILAIIVTLLATPRYTATSQIEIKRESARIVNVQGVEPDTSTADMEFYQTQYGLLASRALAASVSRTLRLADDEQFMEMMGVTSALESKGQLNDRRAREEEVVTTLLKNVNISPIRLSSLVNISFVSPDPETAAKVSNAWAEGFIASNISRGFESTAYARRYLEERLADLRTKLEESERQAVGYASNQAIINLPGNEVSTGDAARDRSLVSDQLAALNTSLAGATADRIQAESRLGRGRGGTSAEALENVAISRLRENLAEARAEYARLLADFTPEYPAAEALKARIDALQSSLRSEEGRVGQTLENQYRDALQRESDLRAQVEGLKGGFNDQRRRAIQYNIFQREVDTNRQIYDALLQRYKEIGVASGVGSNNVSIVDRASPPDKPSSPRPLLNVVIAAFAGLLAGVGLALLREQLDEGFADPNDVERRLGVPLLGVVPRVDEDDRIGEVRDPKSGLAEAYLSIDSRLSFASEEGVPRVLTITSTRPAEGKSTTAFALAYWLARSGSRTLYIDADMRSPSVHELLGVPNGAGLSNVLSGAEKLESVVHSDEANAFDYLTAGPQPPNAAELLRGRGLSSMIEEALTRYDQIVIDSPPVMGLADAPIIGTAAHGTVFVVEAQGIRVRLVQNALDRLRASRTNIVGVILTKFDARRAKTGYDYGYGYGYGEVYGDKETAGQKGSA